MAAQSRETTPRKAGDQIYLCAHDHKGRPRRNPRAIELAVGSAALGDLAIDGYVSLVDGDRLRIRHKGWQYLESPRRRGERTIEHWLLEQISDSPTTVVCDWITAIAPRAPQWIVSGLHAEGLVQPVRRSWAAFWSPKVRYAPVEPHKLGNRLGVALHRRRSLTVAEVFLVGLLQATQLHRAVIEIPNLDELITSALDTLVKPTHPQARARNRSLNALLTHTRHLVNDAALAQTL